MTTYPKWKYLIAHHPPCDKFRSHTLNFKKIQFCIGCYIGIPSTIIGVIVGNLLLSQIVSNFNLLYLGIFLFGFQLLSLTKITEYKIMKVIQKAIIGIGSGFILISAYNLINGSILFRLIILALIIIVGNIPLSFLHTRKSQNICDACEYKWKKEFCPTDYCQADVPDNGN